MTLSRAAWALVLPAAAAALVLCWVFVLAWSDARASRRRCSGRGRR